MTRQRALISRIIHESPEHLTAAALYERARRQMPGLARGTVYRNLRLMEADGEIRRLEMPDGADRYDRAAAPHGHLYCDGCGSLCDLPTEGLQQTLEETVGAPVLGYQLTVHYLCPACRQKSAI